MNIRSKTLLITFVPIIVLVFGAIAVLFLFFEKTSSAVVLRRDSEIARITAERISEGLSRYHNHLQTAALAPATVSFIKYRAGNPSIKNAYLRNVFDNGFAILDKKGNLLWSDSRTSSSLLHLFAGTLSFKKLETTLRPVFSDILKDQQNGQKLFIVAAPVTDRRGNYLGALCGISQLEYSFIEIEFAKMLEIQSGYSGYAYLVDGKGKLIYHRRHNLIGNDFREFEPVRLVIKGKTGAILTRDLEDNSVIGGFSPVPGTPWSVVTHERWDIIFQQVFRYVLFAGVILLGGILVVSLFIFFGIGGALKPVKDLIAGTQQVAQGNFDFRVKARGSDEFSLLSNRFNRMAGQLNETYTRLEEQIHTVEKNERALTALMGNLPGMVFRSANDIIWDMVFVSEGSHDLTGYSPDEITGGRHTTYRELVHVEDRKYVEKTIHDQLQKDSRFEIVHRIHARNNELRWVYMKGSRLTYQGGETFLEGFINDITELRIKDEQLKQAQKMEMIGNLAGGIAHDFNNVLVGITGPLSIIKMDLKKKSDVSKESIMTYLDLIGESGNRASNLVQQLLSLGRKHDLKMEAVDLNDAIGNVVNVCRSSFDKSVHIEEKLPDYPALILADETQIEQSLLNLCVNAAHAMTIMREDKDSYGGKLILSLTEFYADKSFTQGLTNFQEGEFYKISIQDTGVGMAPEVVEKIFDPFYTTKAKGEGSGLGLSMVYNIISEHRGTITVYSEPDIGTTINVFLPAGEGISMKKGGYEQDQLVPGSGSILIVDDEEIMRLSASAILQEAGYQTICAEDGPEALDIFRDRYEELDLVIIDMAMPKMYGDELFRLLKEIDPDVRVLLASGFSQDSRSIQILAEGVKGFLQKPFTMYGLTAKIKEIIEENDED